ncbi:type II secretion system F family protein [Paraburkholderia fungorum]|jgi:type II secretory pathway component PulF|uniref:Type II secretion system (T2SS), F family protein n=1 Tax=Paraburkholderia fungorum TaxID=134537 RepID=A0AAW3V399_9BURK|nr:type II secretion system F family protein [Paraburkholderia fungorum]AJZ56103.1 type II secretion system (T2SS), F family protein [Paraburkholderia fungorum]MBB4516469.1 type II secretory pathway component PulF [Paraburkholderia fungorum]MBB5545274.1 type II secretory pathway component PulF [Paraburkholderia fungorum]MBB6205058.1 type II secretory pathway component PulF [Paraburkholderia fungorum]MBU7440669.1 type II secretion system F family protein [Paraburkholderia fungorum]
MKTGMDWLLRKQLYEQAANDLENKRGIAESLFDFHTRLVQKKKVEEAEIVEKVYRMVDDGTMLANAFDQSGTTLTDIERGLLAGGEKAGRLAVAMRLILDVRGVTSNLQLKLFAAMFTPAVYVVGLYLTLFIVGFWVTPAFEGSLPGSRWTGWAYVLYLMGQLAVGPIAPVFAVASAITATITAKALPRWTGSRREFFDRHIFPFNVYRQVEGLAWVLAFAAMRTANIGEREALSNQIQYASPWLASRLRPIRAGLTGHGVDLAKAMSRSGHQFPSIDMIGEIAAYVRYANFAEVIDKTARAYIKRLERVLIVKAVAYGLLFQLLTFAVGVVIQLGSTSVTEQLATGLHL